MTRRDGASETEGWIQAIRRAGAASRRNESVRKRTMKAAVAGIEAGASDLNGRIPPMIDLMDSGIVTQGEFLEAVRRWASKA